MEGKLGVPVNCVPFQRDVYSAEGGIYWFLRPPRVPRVVAASGSLKGASCTQYFCLFPSSLARASALSATIVVEPLALRRVHRLSFLLFFLNFVRLKRRILEHRIEEHRVSVIVDIFGMFGANGTMNSSTHGTARCRSSRHICDRAVSYLPLRS